MSFTTFWKRENRSNVIHHLLDVSGHPGNDDGWNNRHESIVEHYLVLSHLWNRKTTVAFLLLYIAEFFGVLSSEW